MTVHGKALGDETQVPVGREGGVHRIDGGTVVTGKVLDKDGGIGAAAKVSVGEIGRAGGTHPHGNVEDTVRVAGEGGIVLVLLTGVDVNPQLEPVRHLDVQVGAEVVLVVIGGTLVVNTVLVLAVELHEVAYPFGAAVDAHPILVLEGGRLDDGSQPVRVGIGDGIVLVDVMLHLGVVVHGSAAADGQALVVGCSVQDGIGQFHQPGGLLDTEVIAEGNLGSLVVFAALGGHEDNTVGRAGTVDGSRRVLQDVHAFDFVTGQAAEFVSSSLHAVDDDQGAVVSQGGAASDVHDGVVTAGFAGTVVHDDTGHTAGQTLRKVDGGVFHKFFAGGGGHGAGKGYFPLVAVSDGNRLLENLGVILQHKIHDRAAADFFGGFSVTQKTGNQCCLGRNAGKGVLTVQACHGALAGTALDINHGACYRLSFGVHHRSADADGTFFLRIGSAGRQSQHHAHQKHQDVFYTHV